MPADQTGNRVFKKSFWIAFAFYFLIGFEFFSTIIWHGLKRRSVKRNLERAIGNT